jgi:peptidase E
MVNILMSNISINKRWCRIPLREYIKPNASVTIFGFQFFDNDLNSESDWERLYNKQTGIAYEYIVRQFEFFEIVPKHIKWINYFKDTHQSAVNKIKNADVLLITDGIPRRMMEIIAELDLVDAFKNFKGTMIGFGAGAIIQLLDYQLEPCQYWDFKYFHGLGLVDNIGIVVGFDDGDENNMSIDRFIKEKKKPLYAIFDMGAVVVNNGEVSTIGDAGVLEEVV